MIRQKMDWVPPASGGRSQKALKPQSLPTATYGESLASLRSVPSAWWRPAAPPQRAWGGTGVTLNPTMETSVPPHCTPAAPPPLLQFLPPRHATRPNCADLSPKVASASMEGSVSLRMELKSCVT